MSEMRLGQRPPGVWQNITFEGKARKAGAGVVKWKVWNTST